MDSFLRPSAEPVASATSAPSRPWPTLELHRLGVALVPAAGVKAEEMPIWVRPQDQAKPLRLCGCVVCKQGKTCEGTKELMRGLRALPGDFLDKGWEPRFAASLWHRLARQLAGDAPIACSAVRVRQLVLGDGETTAIQLLAADGSELARYLDDGPSRVVLLERTGKVPAGSAFADRAGVLNRLAMYQRTAQERLFAEKGMPSARHRWEDSFWCRFAYHCEREHGVDAATFFRPSIDRAAGTFHLEVVRGERPLMRLTVPRGRVEAVLKLLAAEFPERPDLAIHPLPLRSIFRVAESTTLDLEVLPEIRLLQATGEVRYLKRPDLERFRYGRLLFVPELELLAELEEPRNERKFATPRAMKLRRSQIPSFLDDHREDLAAGLLVLDEPLRGLKIFRALDRIHLETVAGPEPLTGAGGAERLFAVDAFCEVGGRRVAIAALLDARRRGLPYCEAGDSWIDTQAADVARLEGLPLPAGDDAAQRSRLELSPRHVLQLLGAFGRERIVVTGEGAEELHALLQQQPSHGYAAPAGFRSELRLYQAFGVEWLSSLTAYDLGGLLCDEMGLGKTHQAMAWLAAAAADEPGADPFLVVCPTSVLGHWQEKLSRFAPALDVQVFHGAGRQLRRVPGQVVLTSYGILRNSSQALAKLRWRAILFDEIQSLKNRDTASYEAAAQLGARVKIGLTGTPIENDLDELHALLDLVVPGYLGSEAEFRRRYQAPQDPLRPAGGLEELRRMVSPFLLRRRKASVLSELPAKIEDLRACALSDQQADLYARIQSEKAGQLARQVAAGDGPIPYLHVFAVLNQLKQICDHPALALGDLDHAESYRSGKWDVFVELLQECLEGGLKVVVFSQYLGMLELIDRHLAAQGVGFVRLQGSTEAARRTEIVHRFNTDPACRVFVASLKAGGTGIDLVGGSVVIHYDRWWNAAREDQATDRVHRIGQHRAVQVFKLVTQGTLEERIAEIVARKRDLLDDVVHEDGGSLAKVFSREELLELLRPLAR